MSADPILTNCPTCEKTDTWQATNPNRPFCSDRCKLIDLGAWADESHRVPGDPVDLVHISDEE